MANDHKFSRRQALAALGSVGAAGALGGAATNALLWDEEKFGNATNPNVLQAGSLDLKVDWQESYNGELQEAYPDTDGDNVQDEIYNRTQVQGDPTLLGLSENATDEEIEEAYRNQFADQPESVITLKDVKPGDRGEVTFSFHLFDNPGWISMCGELHEDVDNGVTEPEDKVDGHDPNQSDGNTGSTDEDGNLDDGELADYIQARVWYDLNGDNVLDTAEEPENAEPILMEGSLAEVLNELQSCQVLNPNFYGDHEPSGQTTVEQENQTECTELEKLEWDDENNVLDSEDAVSEGGASGEDADEDGRTVEVVTEGAGGEGYVTDTSGTGTYRFYLDNGNTFVAEIEITVEDRDEDENGQPVEFSYVVTETGSAIGLCEVFVKGGSDGAGPEQDGKKYCYDDCEVKDDGLTPPLKDDGTPYGISNIRFFACVSDGGNGQVPPEEINGDCFVNSTTYHVGFEWWLPRDIPGVKDNIIQTDRTAFQLSFEAVQCRHNVDENGQPITLLPDADEQNNAQHHNETET